MILKLRTRHFKLELDPIRAKKIGRFCDLLCGLVLLSDLTTGSFGQGTKLNMLSNL